MPARTTRRSGPITWAPSLARKPQQMTVCTHMCRRNPRSSWAASGGYDHVAEAVFGELEKKIVETAREVWG